MDIKSHAVIVFVALALAGCDRGTRAEEYFGRDVWSVMEGADKLEAYKLEPTTKPVDGKSVVHPGIAIVGAARDPGEEWLKLFSLLEDPRAYDWKSPVVGSVRPEFLLRFSRQRESVDVLISLSQDALSVGWADPSKPRKWVNIHDAKAGYAEKLSIVFSAADVGLPRRGD